MKKNILLFSIATLFVTFTSCRKDNTVEGPNITDILGEFAITTPFSADRDTVNFAQSEKVIFTAGFNKLTEWKIEITGQNSGARKIIEGQSRAIDLSNGTWLGSTTDLPFFKSELCDVVLTIPGTDDSFSTTVEVKSPKVNSGLLIADFENGINPDWTTFIQTGADMDWAVKNDPTLSPEQNGYLRMSGTVNWDWLIGLVDFNASAYGGITMPLSSNADNEYFNCLVYGSEGNNRTLVLFQFKEDENQDGSFDASTEDQYDLEVWVDWTGWKLVSVKYSDLTHLVNGQPAAPKGNGVHNPDKIGLISLLDLADPSLGYADAGVDYIIFTQNQALQP